MGSDSCACRFTVNAPFFVTHKIDPEVDDARGYLVQDLMASEYLYGLTDAKGAVKASREHPATNLRVIRTSPTACAR